MGHTVFAAPATTPISLSAAKNHLRIDPNDSDDIVDGLLNAAVLLVENETRRALITRTIDFTIDYDWPYDEQRESHRIVLPFPPLQSVTSISYVDTAGATQTLATNQYLVNATGIEGVIEPAYGVSWPSLRRQMNAITVRFVCGYGAAAAVPEPLKQALKLLMWNWHDNPSATIGGNFNEVPMAVQSLMFPYRVFY